MKNSSKKQKQRTPAKEGLGRVHTHNSWHPKAAQWDHVCFNDALLDTPVVLQSAPADSTANVFITLHKAKKAGKDAGDPVEIIDDGINISREQTKALIRHLQALVKTGSLEVKQPEQQEPQTPAVG
jgi:hypothetical protein